MGHSDTEQIASGAIHKDHERANFFCSLSANT